MVSVEPAPVVESGPYGAPGSARRRSATLCSASLLILLAFVGFFYQNFRTIQVSGQSMEPTFQSGDRLLASSAYWLVGPIKDNDIIVVKGESEGEHLIKRVYRMEGESVDWLNIPESHSISEGEYVVPQGHVFVLGDNRDVSEDSRKFGSVPRDRILGKIVIKKWY